MLAACEARVQAPAGSCNHIIRMRLWHALVAYQPHAQGAAGAAMSALTAPGLAAALSAAFVANGLAFAVAMVGAKWALVGRVPAGVHVRHSLFGARFWLAQRAVELGYKRFAMLALGTWGVNAYLRALGARIGRHSTIRFGNPILTPDMLDLGRGCAALPSDRLVLCQQPNSHGGLVLMHGDVRVPKKLCMADGRSPRSEALTADPAARSVHVGDTANVVTAAPLDATRVVTARVEAGDQALLGACAVAMPGARIGGGSILGALAAAEAGADLRPMALFMGAPAKALAKSPVKEGVRRACLAWADVLAPGSAEHWRVSRPLTATRWCWRSCMPSEHTTTGACTCMGCGTSDRDRSDRCPA